MGIINLIEKISICNHSIIVSVMKTNILISLFFIIMASLGCSKQENEKVYAVEFDHFLEVNFRDAAGNDLLIDIPRYIHDPRFLWDEDLGGVLAPETFRMKRVYTMINYINEKELIVREHPVMIFLERGIFKRDFSDRRCFLDARVLIPPFAKFLVEEITYTLICPTLFDDDKEHNMVTSWKFPDGFDFAAFREKWEITNEEGTVYDHALPTVQCYRLTIDGREYPITQEPFIYWAYNGGPNDESLSESDISVAWVTLDK